MNVIFTLGKTLGLLS